MVGLPVLVLPFAPLLRPGAKYYSGHNKQYALQKSHLCAIQRISHGIKNVSIDSPMSTSFSHSSWYLCMYIGV